MKPTRPHQTHIVLSVLAVCLLGAAAAAPPAPVTRAYGASQSAIASTVSVPSGYTTIYVSGTIPAVVDPKAPAGSTAAYGGGTEAQTEGALKKIETALAAQGAGFGDVVMMHAYLVGVPEAAGRMDFAGMNAAYNRHFGTSQQPNKPARSTVQVAGLAYPGVLVQIEMIAVKKP